MRADGEDVEFGGGEYSLNKMDDGFAEEIVFQVGKPGLDALVQATYFTMSFCGLEFAPDKQQMATIRDFVRSSLIEDHGAARLNL